MSKAKVSYDYFNNKRDYPKWPNYSLKCHLDISKRDFLKYAILNGRYNNNIMSGTAQTFYYDAFIKYVKSLEVDCEPMLIDEQDYCCWGYDNERYCILGTIYNLVKSHEYNEKNKYRNFNDSVNKELSKIKNLERILPDASSYEDGIIICNPNIKPDNN